MRACCRHILTVLLLCACAEEAPPEPDILALAERNPLGEQVQAPDGTYRTPRYGDAALEQAEIVLRDTPRPWTVSRMLRRFREAESAEERALILRVLAASRDPRAAVVLGETLHDDALDVRVAATLGIADYFLEERYGGGNLESLMTDADEWWKGHEAELRREAARLAHRWPER